MLGVGAVAAAVTAGIGGGPVAQVVIFALVSVALILVVRPLARRSRAQGPEMRSGVDALKGRQALVLEKVDGQGGRIKLAGEIWSARSLDTAGSYEPGSQVDVVEIDGATAIVM